MGVAISSNFSLMTQNEKKITNKTIKERGTKRNIEDVKAKTQRSCKYRSFIPNILCCDCSRPELVSQPQIRSLELKSVQKFSSLHSDQDSNGGTIDGGLKFDGDSMVMDTNHASLPESEIPILAREPSFLSISLKNHDQGRRNSAIILNDPDAPFINKLDHHAQYQKVPFIVLDQQHYSHPDEDCKPHSYKFINDPCENQYFADSNKRQQSTIHACSSSAILDITKLKEKRIRASRAKLMRQMSCKPHMWNSSSSPQEILPQSILSVPTVQCPALSPRSSKQPVRPEVTKELELEIVRLFRYVFGSQDDSYSHYLKSEEDKDLEMYKNFVNSTKDQYYSFLLDVFECHLKHICHPT